LALVFTVESSFGHLRRMYGLLLPLYALMLIGLTFRKDPLARLFALASPELERSAYPIFVLHSVVADLWGTFNVKVPSRTAARHNPRQNSSSSHSRAALLSLY